MKFFRPAKSRRAFTMIEIAICLAIIGFALVAIMLALPYGLNTQRDNRQETVIGQDATVLIELIRSGSRGADDLTNYVYLISNTVTAYNGNGVPSASSDVYGYTYSSATLNGAAVNYAITNGARIIGLLSTPQFYTNNPNPPYGLIPLSNVLHGGISNHVVAYVRSMSGLAAEKPPQAADSLLAEDSFTYRLYIENGFVAQDTNNPTLPAYDKNLGATLHELRLTFRWPVLPNGSVVNQGASPQTFRASIAGDLKSDPASGLFYYQPQTFTAAP